MSQSSVLVAWVLMVVHAVLVTASQAVLDQSSSSSKQGSTKSVWVVTGGRADLPCRPQPKLADEQPVLVLWYRGSDTVPVYSYDARVGDFPSGVRWADETALGSRAYFMAMSDPPTLALEPAHARDQGVYKCRVDYRLSPSTTVYVNLTVVIPPGPPTVLWRGHPVVGAVGPLSEDEKTELTCRSVGGRPSPVLTWYHKGRRLPLLSANSYLDPVTGTYTAEVVLSMRATRDLLGVTLTCHAHTPTHAHTSSTHAHTPSTHLVQDTIVIQPRTASVTLNITLSPVEVRVVGGGAGVRAGTTLRLVCRAAGSHPPAHLTWWRAHARLPHVTHAIEDGGNVTTATLTIVVRREHDGAVLSCTGANPVLHHAPLTDTVTLVVFYAPVVGLGLGRNMNPELIKEGDDVYFECSIEANPTFHGVDWHHNGVELVHNMSAGVVMNGLDLVIRNLQRRHSGSYTCTAANTEARTTSNAVHLTVRHAPVCAGDKRERTQGAARGSTAAVKCTVEAEPSHDLTWTWIRKRADGSEEEVPREDVRSEGLTSSVLLTPHTPDDYGRLLCSAANAVGSQLTTCVVNLVPAGPPDTPTNCSATPGKPPTAHSATPGRPPNHPYTASLSITCLEGFDGGLPQHFLMEVWQQGDLIANMTSEYPEWVVTDLRAGVGVSLRVSAHNARGRSDQLVMEVHTTSAQQHAAPDAAGVVDIPPILGAALGLVGVLLLLLIVGVVVAKKVRTRRRPQKVSIEVPLTPTMGEGFDPDVVASIQRRPPSLDVIPQDDDQDDEHSYEHHRLHDDDDDDDSESQTPRESCPYIHRACEGQEDSDICSCGHRRLGRDHHHHHHHHALSHASHNRQDDAVTDTQSEDSGVSESESDSELRELMSDDQVEAVIRQHPDSGRAYVTYSQTSPDAEMRLGSAAHLDLRAKPLPSDLHSKKSSPVEIRLKPFVSRDYKASPLSAAELRLKPASCRELKLVPASSGEVRTARASPSDVRVPSTVGELTAEDTWGSKPPTTQREVICLPISPGEAQKSHTSLERRSREAANRSQPKKTSQKVRPVSAKDLQCVHVSKDFPVQDQSKHRMKERSDRGKSVTLVEGEHGEIMLVTRTSEGKSMKGGSRHCAPVFPSVKVSDSCESQALPTKPVTLPKAAAKNSRTKALRKAMARKDGVLEHPSNLPPSVAALYSRSEEGQTVVSPAGKRTFHTPPNPDVCRRESSV